jgi:hypothetical protein
MIVASIATWKDDDDNGDPLYEKDILVEVTDRAYDVNGESGWIEIHFDSGWDTNTHLRFKLADLVRDVLSGK